MIPPVIQIEGHWYLVVNWDYDNPPGPEHHLLLRPLSPNETAWFRDYRASQEREVHALLVVQDEDRFGRKMGDQ